MCLLGGGGGVSNLVFFNAQSTITVISGQLGVGGGGGCLMTDLCVF